jgi:hypothetical protein
MTLPALTWKELPEFSVSSTVDKTTFVTTIRNALTGTVYSDGSARTPGSGVAWSSSVAADGIVVCTPASSSMGLQVVFKASSGTQASQSYALGSSAAYGYYTFASMILNGTYSATNVASPVSAGGRWFGWVDHSALSSWSFTGIKIYESQDALCIVAKQSNTGTLLNVPFLIGGFIDPESSSHPDGETDGKIYAVCTPGDIQAGAGYYAKDFMRTAASYFTGFNGLGLGPKAGYFLPGSSLTSAMRRIGLHNFTQTGSATSDTNKNLNSNYVLIPLFCSSANYFVGRFREIYPGPQAISGQVLKSGATEIGFLVGFGRSSNDDTIILKK